MSMHSLMFVMIALLLVIALLGGLLAIMRVWAAREVESDHPTRPRPR